MTIRVADLLVRLGANSVELNKTLANTRKRMRRWGRDVNRISTDTAATFNKIAISATIASGAIATVITRTAQDLDNLGKFAERLGVEVNQLQELRLAGTFAGLGTQQVDIALQRMTRRVAEAAQGLGEAKTAIAELGLEATALNQLSPDQQFREITKALSEIPNQADRVRLAFKLFDSEGVGLVNIRPEVIQEAADALDRMGGRLSSLEIGQIEAMNDSFLKVQEAIGIVNQRVVVGLSGALSAAADEIFDLITAEGQLKEITDQLVNTILDNTAKLLRASSSIISFVDSNSDVVQFGVIGYLLFGRKGAALGAFIGLISQKLDELTGGSLGRLKSQIIATENEIALLQQNLARTDGLANLTLDRDALGVQLDEAVDRLGRLREEMESAGGSADLALAQFVKDAQQAKDETNGLADALNSLASTIESRPSSAALPSTGSGGVSEFEEREVKARVVVANVDLVMEQFVKDVEDALQAGPIPINFELGSANDDIFKLTDGVEQLGRVFGSLSGTFEGQSKRIAQLFSALHGAIATMAAYSAAAQSLASIEAPTVFQKLAAYGKVLAVGLGAAAQIHSIGKSASSGSSGASANPNVAGVSDIADTTSQANQEDDVQPVINILPRDRYTTADEFSDGVLNALKDAGVNRRVRLNVEKALLEVAA